MRIFNYLVLVISLAAMAAEVPSENTAGVGVVLGIEGQSIVVRSILLDSPAATQKNIHVGDRIIAVAQGNEPAVQIEGRRLAQAVPLFRGPKGTTVRLTVVPFGAEDSQARVVSFVRGELKALSAWGDGELLSMGTKAPDIEMAKLGSGTSERLSEYAGKIIVLEFWATWCGPCQPKMATLQTYLGEYPEWKDKVVLIAASVDENQEAPTKHLQAKGWGQTHNVWVSIDARKAYHINAIPTAYVINRQGIIVAANPADLPAIVNHELQTGSNIEDNLAVSHSAFTNCLERIRRA
jgi:thiol-disulfide isomerase/thioredoxin